MTKPMPQTGHCAQQNAAPPSFQTYLPIFRNGSLLLCTDSRGKVWPCLSLNEWSKEPSGAINDWKSAYGLRERQPQNGPSRNCKTCQRAVCVWPNIRP